MEAGRPIASMEALWRQVIPLPLPVRLVDQNMRALRVLTDNDCIVICAGGGGIPVTEEIETDSIGRVEAVIDEDLSAVMLAKDLDADGLLILTDVKAVAIGFATKNPKWIKSASPDMLLKLMHEFPAGSMGPKVESAIECVAQKER
jgi:carbamate kinase